MIKLLKNRWVRRVVLGTAGVVVCAAGLTVYLLKRPPAVWQEAQHVLAELSPAERAALAQGVFDRLAAVGFSGPDGGEQNIELFPGIGTTGDGGNALNKLELTKQHIDETFELKMSNDELIAVVSETFVDWAEQRGYEVPASISTPIIMAEGGRLVFAFELTTPSWEQVFSGDIDLRFDPDGMAHGKVDEVLAGSLPVSITSIGDMLREKLPESEAGLPKKAGEWLKELKDFEFRPVFEIEHRRRARILAMDIGDSEVTVTMRVQDHRTYKAHNGLMKTGQVAVTDTLTSPTNWDGSAFADVPTTTD